MESKDNILSYKLFLQQEYANYHLPYDKEMLFYNAVRNGDFEVVKKNMNPLTSTGLGKLSDKLLEKYKLYGVENGTEKN